MGPREAYVRFTGVDLDDAALASLTALLASKVPWEDATAAVVALRELPAGARAGALSLLGALRRKAAPDAVLTAAEARAAQETAGTDDAPDGGGGAPADVVAAWDAHRGQPEQRRAGMVRLLRALARRRFPAVALARVRARIDQEPDL